MHGLQATSGVSFTQNTAHEETAVGRSKKKSKTVHLQVAGLSLSWELFAHR